VVRHSGRRSASLRGNWRKARGNVGLEAVRYESPFVLTAGSNTTRRNEVRSWFDTSVEPTEKAGRTDEEVARDGVDDDFHACPFGIMTRG
jgi:hypothetical protein